MIGSFVSWNELSCNRHKYLIDTITRILKNIRPHENLIFPTNKFPIKITKKNKRKNYSKVE